MPGQSCPCKDRFADCVAFLGNDCPRKVAEWRDPRLMIVIIVKIARDTLVLVTISILAWYT
jgi:hypothetical protein